MFVVYDSMFFFGKSKSILTLYSEKSLLTLCKYHPLDKYNFSLQLRNRGWVSSFYNTHFYDIYASLNLGVRSRGSSYCPSKSWTTRKVQRCPEWERTIAQGSTIWLQTCPYFGPSDWKHGRVCYLYPFCVVLIADEPETLFFYLQSREDRYSSRCWIMHSCWRERYILRSSFLDFVIIFIGLLIPKIMEQG